MARSHSSSRSSSFSRSLSRVRVGSPSLQRKKTPDHSNQTDQRIEFLSNGGEETIDYGDIFNNNDRPSVENGGEEESGGSDSSSGGGNKVMVVVDSSLDSNGALEWALSHAIQNQDTVILIHVTKSSKRGYKKEPSDGKPSLKVYEQLQSMQNTCKIKRPGARVSLVTLEGKDKGKAIVEEAKRQKVSLLVLGQKKRSIIWRLIKRWIIKKRNLGGIVDYCIQNASCMTVAVRRKGKKLGGYLITTKRHKNFWLLA